MVKEHFTKRLLILLIFIQVTCAVQTLASRVIVMAAAEVGGNNTAGIEYIEGTLIQWEEWYWCCMCASGPNMESELVECTNSACQAWGHSKCYGIEGKDLTNYPHVCAACEQDIVIDECPSPDAMKQTTDVIRRDVLGGGNGNDDENDVTMQHTGNTKRGRKRNKRGDILNNDNSYSEVFNSHEYDDNDADICSLNKRSRPNDISIIEDPNVLLPVSISNNPKDDIPADPNISTSNTYGPPNNVSCPNNASQLVDCAKSGCEDEMKDVLGSGCGDNDCNDVLMQDNNTISSEIWEFLIEFDPILWSVRRGIVETRIQEEIMSRGGTFIATPGTGNCLPQCCVYYNDGNFDENKSMIERFIMANYSIQNPAEFADIGDTNKFFENKVHMYVEHITGWHLSTNTNVILLMYDEDKDGFQEYIWFKQEWTGTNGRICGMLYTKYGRYGHFDFVDGLRMLQSPSTSQIYPSGNKSIKLVEFDQKYSITTQNIQQNTVKKYDIIIDPIKLIANSYKCKSKALK